MFNKKSFLVLLVFFVLAVQLLFGQSKGMMIYLSDGSIKKLAISQIDSINFNACVDIDSNIYPTVKIGDQWWMAENLKVTRYRNGDDIPIVTDDTEWKNLTTGAYCNYNNNSDNADIYGRLYNWYAVNDSRNIAPLGWHVPSDEEWQTLIDYLGGESVAGGKLKETGTTHWNSPNEGATNESGFAALPGGYRNDTGTFDDLGRNAHFWSSAEDSSSHAWNRELGYTNATVHRSSYDKQNGFSVRLVRD